MKSIIKFTLTILAFIFTGTLFAVFFGLVEQMSNFFYIKSQGKIAGEYQVRITLEDLANRGLVGLPYNNGQVYLAWRFLENDQTDTGFNIYRSVISGGPYTLLNTTPLTPSTNYLDNSASQGNTYYYLVRPINGGTEGDDSNEVSVTAANSGRDYFSFPTEQGYVKSSVGDLNGDGWLDFVVLEPRIWNSEESDILDNERLPDGQEYQIAAYAHNGSFLWRYNTHLGQSSYDYHWAHSANYTVYDLNNDGRAEVFTIIRDGENYRLARLSGINGNVEAVSDIFPHEWIYDETGGEQQYFRIYLAIAYLDGLNPSVIMQAGRGRGACGNGLDAYIIAFDNNLGIAWNIAPGDCQSGHGMEILDADGDGRDEILMGDNLVDDNGSLRWSRYGQHVDVMVSGDIDLNNPGLEIFFGWEAPWRVDGAKMELVRAVDGSVLWHKDNLDEVAHGGIGNFTDDPGLEIFAFDNRAYHSGESEIPYLIASDGRELVGAQYWPLERFPAHWNGDGRTQMVNNNENFALEINNYDHSLVRRFSETEVQKWQEPMAVDLFGDWRDEIVALTDDNRVYIYTNTAVIDNRQITSLQDRHYRINITRFHQGYFKHLNRSNVSLNQSALTCAEQGGNICNAGQSCPGVWLLASDANYCCDGSCQTGGSVCGDGHCDNGETVDSCPNDCQVPSGPCVNGPDGAICLAANARNPSIFKDYEGSLHIAYDANCSLNNLDCEVWYVKYICQNGRGALDEATRQKVGDGFNSRIAVDSSNNPHIAWDEPTEYFVSGRDGVKYNRIVNGSQAWPGTGQLIYRKSHSVEKSRIAIDGNNEVYISFQNIPHLSFVHFNAAAQVSEFSDRQLITVDANADNDEKGIRQGGIAIDRNNGVHFSWSHYPEGAYYRKYYNGSFDAIMRLTENIGWESVSDFTSLTVNRSNNDIVYSAQPGNVDNPGNPDYGSLFFGNFGSSVDVNERLTPSHFGPEVTNIADGDDLNVEVVVDARNVAYVTFAGADPGIVDSPTHPAYYYTVSGSNVSALNRLTPGAISNQGNKKRNPIAAPAFNQGVFVAYEDDYTGDYNVYLKSLDGADVCAEPEPVCRLRYDLNCDLVIDILDFGILMSCWGVDNPDSCASAAQPAQCASADMNDNDAVSVDDLGAMLSCWGNPDCARTNCCLCQ